MTRRRPRCGLDSAGWSRDAAGSAKCAHARIYYMKGKDLELTTCCKFVLSGVNIARLTRCQWHAQLGRKVHSALRGGHEDEIERQVSVARK